MKARAVKDKIKEIVGADNIEFLSHSKNYLSARVFAMILSVVGVPIFTRLLDPSEYGILSIFVSFCSFLTLLFGLGFNSSVIRYYYEKTGDFRQFLGSNIIFMLAFNIIAVSGLYFLTGTIAQFVKIEASLLFMAALFAAFAVPITIYLFYLIASKQSGKFSTISITRDLAVFVLSVIWVWSLQENRYLGRIYSSLLVMAVFWVYSLYRIIKVSKLSLDFRYIKYALTYGLFLVPHNLSAVMLIWFDRVIINQLVSSSAAGVYDVAYKVGMLMNAVVMAMSVSWEPIFFGHLRERRFEKVRNLAHNYSKYIYFSAIGLILFSREAVIILADKKFHAALDLVPVIVLSYVFLFLFTLYAYFSLYRKKTALISLISLIACAANIGLNYWLIPKFGYEAAAYTTLASYFLLFVLHYLNARLVLRVNVIPLLSVLPNFSLVFGAVASLVLTTRYISILSVSIAVKIGLILLAGSYLFLWKKEKNKNPTANLR